MSIAGRATFAIGISQVAVLFSVPPKNIQRDLEALLNLDRSFLKVKSDLNSKPVNTINFDQLNKVISTFNKKGNPIAIELVDSCLGLSLYQRACDSFGLKFEADDRSSFRLISKQNTRRIDRAAGVLFRD